MGFRFGEKGADGVNGQMEERIRWSAARSGADKASGGEREDSPCTGDSLGRTSNSAVDVDVTDRID